MTIRYILGIDPGAHTGLALFDATTQRWLTVREVDFWQAFEFVTREAWPADGWEFTKQNLLIVIEAGGLNSPTFHTAANWAAQNKTSQRVGGANREADLLANGLTRHGWQVVRVRPTSRKWSAADARTETGYTGRTNEHTRDAMKLAWQNKHLKLMRVQAS